MKKHFAETAPCSKTLFFARLLAFFATLMSLYLACSSLFAGGKIWGCVEGAGCSEVLSSPWSHWLGIPVSLAGVLVYGAIFFLLPQVWRWKKWLAFLIVLAAGSAFWFLFVQIVILREICLYCSTVHLSGILIFTLFFARLIPEPERQEAPEKTWLPGLLLGLLGVGILIGGQLWFNPEPPRSLAHSQLDSLTERRKMIDSTLFTDRAFGKKVELLRGAIKTTLGEFPVLGSPAAPKFVGMFFDYTCRACRLAHDFIGVLMNRYPGQFALILFPVPLSSACNPYVKGPDTRESRAACLFAKLALLVWRERPQDFARFDHFMFHDPEPPPADSARAFVSRLLGRPVTKTDLKNDSLLARLEQSLALFHHPEIKRQMLPVLLFPAGIHYGMTRSPLEIVARIRQELNLQSTR